MNRRNRGNLRATGRAAQGLLGDAAALACVCIPVLTLPACGGNEPEAPVAWQDPGKSPKEGPPAAVVGGFQVNLPEVVLDPGEEKLLCYVAPLEMQGPSRMIGGGSLTTTAGMHHGNVTTRKRTGEGLRVCESEEEGSAALNALKGGAVLFGSSTQVAGTEWQTFPEGMAFRVPEDQEVILQMHYLNATSESLTVAPHYAWYAVDEASVTQELGPFAWRAANFELLPGSETTFTSACRFPAPMHIVHVLPHMHRLGTALTASYLGGAHDGELFLQSSGYNPDSGVMRVYEPAVDLSQGEGARFSCTWSNTLGKTIVEGLGDNEMCILFGYAYPPESAFTAVAAGEDTCVVLAPEVPGKPAGDP